MSNAGNSPGTPPAANNSRRNRAFAILGTVIVVAGLGYLAYWFFSARFYETTDDAYVAGNVISVTAREPATVMTLYADNTQTVKRGQLLIAMDPAVANVNMQAAEANLARVVRSVRGAFSHADSFNAQLAQAQVALTQAQTDFKRRQSAAPGAVSAEELAHARANVSAAQAAVAAAAGGRAQAEAPIQGSSIASNPDVLSAIAQLRNTSIALGHMQVVAPVDGIIAQRTVQVGQQVAGGTPLMAVVPLDNVWVDANFKEVQLEDMRIGQKVTVTADMYGSGVKYHGKVEGLGAGSGSAFALLPPQNASGNWIKVVQRVPVRIALDPAELKDHPLRVGLSVTAIVDISDTSGPMVTAQVGPKETRGDTGTDTTIQTDALIARILAENGAAPRNGNAAPQGASAQ